MAKKRDKTHQKLVESEIGAIRKPANGGISVALVYPNTYHVGMSNLGFQTLYKLINHIENVVCERAFLPDRTEKSANCITTLESGRNISDFDVIAFSVSFENDYPNLLTILEMARLPLKAVDRNIPHPLVIAGGVALFLNPEPVAPFIDCILIGEAEVILDKFFDILSSSPLNEDRMQLLKTLAQNVPGTYVPQFYRVENNPDGTPVSFEPLCDVPSKIKRVYAKDLSSFSTCTTILTPHTTFDGTFLIEVGRGCPHGCRFCSAGFIYRPPRFRSLSVLEQCLQQGILLSDKLGLVGAAVSDLPDIDQLCSGVLDKNARISFSSLRADGLSPNLLTVLKQSRVKTATIAPDAGSERMGRVVNKKISEENILAAAEKLVEAGVPNLKLYYMVGLPTETMDDVEAIVTICKKIKHRFLKSSRIRKKMGDITVSLNCFVPKPFTPFQWAAMDSVKSLKMKIKKVKEGLKKVANVSVHADVPRWAYIQALLSRGDRKVAQILLSAHQNRGNWPKTFKSTPVNADFYVLRERSLDEMLPWDFIDNCIDKSFLKKEYIKAKNAETSPDCPMKSCTICGVCTGE